MAPTLATTLKDPAIKKKFIEINPSSNKIASYVFHHNEVQEDRRCTECELEIAKLEGGKMGIKKSIVNNKEIESKTHLIWCLPCDRLYHLSCARISKLTDADTPWFCEECLTNPDNASAAALTDKTKLMSFEDRLKEIEFQEESSSPQFSEEVLEFFNNTLQISRINGHFNLAEVKTLYEEQQAEMMKLGTKYQEAQFKIIELTAKVENLKEENSLLSLNIEKKNIEEKTKRVINAERYDLPNVSAHPQSFIHSTTFTPQHTNAFDANASAIEAIQKIELNHLRNALPIIKEYNGDPSKWLVFERAVELVQSEGRYDDQYMKYIIRDRLTGLAAKLVDQMYATHSFSQIMRKLRSAFGDSECIVQSARNQILEVKLPRSLTKAVIIETTTKISAFIQACKQADIDTNERSLALHIYKQLDPRYVEGYLTFYKIKYPIKAKDVRLDILQEYLESIEDSVPIGTFTTLDSKDHTKSKASGFQVASISASANRSQAVANRSNQRVSSHSRNPRAQTDSFQIRDINTAKYQGYYIDKLEPFLSHCFLCNKNGHFTIECRNYKKKSIEERQRFVESKSLCPSCIVTTEHQARNCSLKRFCGAHLGDGQRCELKHHISLHVKPSRKTANSKSPPTAPSMARSSSVGLPSSSSAATKGNYQGFPVSNQQSTANPIFALKSQEGFQVNTISALNSTPVESSPRTVKLFRVFIPYQGKTASTFAVGDSAAEITLVKRSLVDALGITGPPCTLQVNWTNSTQYSMTGIKVNIPIKGILPNSREFLLSDCYAIESFNPPLRSLNVEEIKQRYEYLQPVQFESYKDVRPCVLLGSKHAALVEAIKLWEDGPNKPIGVLTKLGYSIYGGLPTKEENSSMITTIASEAIEQAESEEELVSNEELSKQLEFSNSLESLKLKPPGSCYTADEKSALAQANSGLKHLKSGFIQMPLIWKLQNGIKPKLPDNFAMVFKRQLAQENKLKKNPELLEAFNNNFKAIIDEGYVRAATEADMHTPGNTNYVPMSLVVNMNKRPIKTRNVYDASAKYKGTSLNDNLLSGPNLLIDLLKPLMSMRENKIAVTGDIRQMFHRIKIAPEDQNCQRILWRADAKDPMQIFIQQSMLFGPTCSPFVSQYVKNWAAKQFAKKYPITSSSIKKDSYMDDWLTSFANALEAIKCLKEGIEIFEFIQMQLVSIQSNCAEVLAALPESHLKKELVPLLSGIQDLTHYVSKVLGVSWNIQIDRLVFEVNKELLKDKFQELGIRPTKRELCSLIARIFDVLGLLAHCIIRGKIILQHCWKKQIDWDQQIPEEEANLWSDWLKDLQKASTIRIPRQRSALDRFSDAESIECHTFCDAGKEAMAAVSYLVAVYNGRREASFALAKAKVAPIKLSNKQEITEMPRLEVLAALLGARLSFHITQLHDHLKIKHFMWSDSEVVLKWLWNPNIKLPKFASSPIGEILDLTKAENWRYVESKLNVADLATKFQPFDFSDQNSAWFKGPKFISMDPINWPAQKIPEEMSKSATICTTQLISLDKKPSENPLELLPRNLPPYECPLLSITNKETGEIQHSAIMNQLIKRKPSIYYNWSKLIRATARMLIIRNEILIPLLASTKWRSRTARRDIIKASKIKESINPDYLHKAELFIIRYMQRQKWPEEIEALRKGHRTNNKEFNQLNVFLDKDEILRINSRVALSFAEYPQKYAPLVPNLTEKNSLSETMLFHYHYAYRHICPEAQMAEFRSKYWMNALRERLRSITHRCNHCKILRAKQVSPLMADLPDFRIDRKLKPFEVTGLDCCGPFIVSRNKKQFKIWILLFTCAVTRFIHLEILENMDTQSTLAAITSANAAHGPFIRLISDHGTNFIGASNVLHREQEKMMKELEKSKKEVNQHFSTTLKSFMWEFLPVKAPWFGGFIERLIGEVKRGMRDELRTKGIDIRVFKIAMYETSMRLNCRPLTHLPLSHEEEEILTPHHLAKNRPGWPLLPSAEIIKNPKSYEIDRTYFQEGQKLASKITSRFYKYYLSELTSRKKWNRKQPSLEKGDLVLIIDPNNTRFHWQRGRIRNFIPSRDGIHRVAEVETSDANIKTRSVQHLVKINIEPT